MSIVNGGEDCCSALELDEWQAGELEPEQQQRLQAHLGSCAHCRQRYALLEAARAAFLQQRPSWSALHARRAPAPANRSRAVRSWGAAALLGAGALLGAIWLRAPAAPPQLAIRSKGGPAIGVYIKRGAQVIRGASGDVVHPGEQLRFSYTSETATHLALFGRDARAATTFYPLGADTLRVESGRDVALDFGIELDEQPGPEQIHALFCPQPIALAPMRAALAESGRLPVPSGCHADVIVLEKRVAE